MKTGKYLYEDFFHHNDINNEYGFEYQTVKNVDGLKIFLEIIYSEVINKKVYPIIHIEMHGGEDGIELSNGDIIEWRELALLLQKINIELKNKLVVIFAFCYGIHFLSVFYDFITSRTPFAGLITSADYVMAGEIRDGFLQFYRKIFETRNGNDALKGLNDFIHEEDRKYSFLSCRWLFKEAFIKYLKLCSAKERTQRTERIITKIKKTNPNAEITKTRKEIKQYLHKNNQREYFTAARNNFLMYDLDESNKALFNINYQEVMNEI